MLDIAIFLALVSLGYFAGSYAERKHYKSIEKREAEYQSLPVSTMRKLNRKDRVVRERRLVMGNCCVSVDYFKRILAGLRNIFGGEMGSYSSLIDRARREAILRAIEQAEGADMVIALRIETSSIGQSANRRNAVGSIEALAYGTAIFYEPAQRA